MNFKSFILLGLVAVGVAARGEYFQWNGFAVETVPTSSEIAEGAYLNFYNGQTSQLSASGVIYESLTPEQAAEQKIAATKYREKMAWIKTEHPITFKTTSYSGHVSLGQGDEVCGDVDVKFLWFANENTRRYVRWVEIWAEASDSEGKYVLTATLGNGTVLGSDTIAGTQQTRCHFDFPEPMCETVLLHFEDLGGKGFLHLDNLWAECYRAAYYEDAPIYYATWRSDLSTEDVADFVMPELISTDETDIASLGLIYWSSNTKVAKVDAATGAVTLTGEEGSATVKARHESTAYDSQYGNTEVASHLITVRQLDCVNVDLDAYFNGWENSADTSPLLSTDNKYCFTVTPVRYKSTVTAKLYMQHFFNCASYAASSTTEAKFMKRIFFPNLSSASTSCVRLDAPAGYLMKQIHYVTYNSSTDKLVTVSKSFSAEPVKYYEIEPQVSNAVNILSLRVHLTPIIPTLFAEVSTVDDNITLIISGVDNDCEKLLYRITGARSGAEEWLTATAGEDGWSYVADNATWRFSADRMSVGATLYVKAVNTSTGDESDVIDFTRNSSGGIVTELTEDRLTSCDSAPIYDLLGRRLVSPPRGLYIRAGSLRR